MKKFLGILLLIFLHVSILAEDTTKEKLSFFDKNDSMLDLSNYLSQAYGFLPVPILITEPAIGYGGGAALVYLHDKLGGKKSSTGRNIPPSISGVVLAATENKTYLGALFHIGYYMQDTIRTQSFIGIPNININFYTQNKEAVFINLSGAFAYQSLKFRLFDSNFFLGTSLLYSELTNSIKNNNSEISIPEITVKNTAAAFLFDYDSRDNTLSPNSGMIFNAIAVFFDKNLGGDYSFQRYLFQELLYLPVSTTLNFDQRIAYGQIVGEETPFYLYPSINLRGVPTMKYQGEKTALYEAQLRWEFMPRWSGLVFGGIAKAYGKDKFLPDLIETSFNDAKIVYSKGIGFRYLIAKSFGLRVGVDIASSNEDEAFYIQFGTAWMGL
jgi:outer membrane protein assembly factor BamA